MMETHLMAMFRNTALTTPALYRNAAGEIVELTLSHKIQKSSGFGFDGSTVGAYSEFTVLKQKIASPAQGDQIALHKRLADLADLPEGFWDSPEVLHVKQITPSSSGLIFKLRMGEKDE